MNKHLTSIMLVDDNPNDNFFHEREIKKSNVSNIVITKNTGQKALDYLKSKKERPEQQPDVIFLDLNMPDMNGWDFLREYNLLDLDLQRRAVIILLTTSQNPDDEARAKTWSSVADYITKPLTRELVKDISEKYFK